VHAKFVDVADGQLDREQQIGVAVSVLDELLQVGTHVFRNETLAAHFARNGQSNAFKPDVVCAFPRK
jgi:hypothetical protein